MPRDLPRRALAAALLVIGLLVTGLGTTVASPAHAEPAFQVQLSSIDLSLPGHARGTVTTDASHVWLCFANCQVNSGSWLPVPSETHELAFDLPTWGFRNGTVTAAACGSDPGPTCAGMSTAESEPFDTVDVVPAVTWPEDTTIGRNSDGTLQEYAVTVADPAGGGVLRTLFDVGDQVLETLVNRNGTTSLSLASGSGTVMVQRCQNASSYNCTIYLPEDHPELSRSLTVKRTLRALFTGSSGAVTSADPAVDAFLDTNLNGTYALDWRLSLDGTPVTDVTHQEGTLSATGDLTVPVDGAQLPDGDLALVGSLSVTDPDFGPFTSPVTQETSIHVDRTPPGIDGLAVSRRAIHPNAVAALAGYRSVSISLLDDEQLDYTDLVEIRDANGNPVRRLEPNWLSALLGKTTWDGRNDSGTVVPEGTYTVAVVDAHGNAAPITRTVTVSHDTGVLRTFRRTVSASGSLEAKYVGACSTLRRPSLRGWTGSLGYYANTRCSRDTWKASAVTTLHAVRLPHPSNFVRYHDQRVDTYGGAARVRPRSTALVRHLRTDGSWVDRQVLDSWVGTHAGTRRSTSGMVGSQHRIRWGAAAADGNRYDVKSFTVVVRYYVWS